MNPQVAVSKAPAIHPGTQIGAITLRVANLERAARFYEDVLGFRRVEQAAGSKPAAPPRARLEAVSRQAAGSVSRLTADSLTLGAEGTAPLLELRETPGARPMPRHASGLYHFAILVPTRADLGRSLRRLADAGIEIGSSDHLVSEALYLSDPDGNGIEIYRDRPRASWKWKGSVVQMAVDPLDLDGLLAEGARDARPWSGLSAGTRIGHIHLQVGDIAQALAFYQGLLGFELTAQMPGAAFISAGGYHHHIGMNTWHSRGAPPAPSGSAGLQAFVVEVPDAQEQARLSERLSAAGIPVTQHDGNVSARDPWNNEVIVAVR
jgi:catechol 2,3-dioxygenase